jgi:hypothetical protein
MVMPLLSNSMVPMCVISVWVCFAVSSATQDQ